MATWSSSIVDYRGYQGSYRCGYCRSTDTKFSHGMWAHSMTVQDYQALVDRGWRRSGKYCYKPTMDVTCCPQYPIRCIAGDYKPSKSNKKVIKRFNRYINKGVRPAAAEEPDVAMEEAIEEVSVVGSLEPLEDMAIVEGDPGPGAGAVSSSQPGSPVSQEITRQPAQPTEVQPAQPTEVQPAQPTEVPSGTKNEIKPMRVSKVITPGKGPDPSKPLCQKAKLRRRQHWLKKHCATSLQQEGPSLSSGTSNEPKSLEKFLEGIVENPAHKLEVHLIRSTPKSEEFKNTFLESYGVYERYQMAIHHDKPSDCDQETFVNFLVDSPLKPYHREGGSSDGYGSFHQQYIIDGKIVAVGVIDILPSCVSSVYLYYDPDFFFLSLGTYTAVRELAFTQHMHSLEPSIEYYYMGFYIHSCPKMKYKGQYSPSFLLCPETYKWFPIEECEPKLDANKYSRFATGGEVDADGDVDIDEVLVLFARQAMPFLIYRQISPEGEDDEEEVLEYARFTGRSCSKRMLLYRS